MRTIKCAECHKPLEIENGSRRRYCPECAVKVRKRKRSESARIRYQERKGKERAATKEKFFPRDYVERQKAETIEMYARVKV